MIGYPPLLKSPPANCVQIHASTDTIVCALPDAFSPISMSHSMEINEKARTKWESSLVHYLAYPQS